MVSDTRNAAEERRESREVEGGLARVSRGMNFLKDDGTAGSIIYESRRMPKDPNSYDPDAAYISVLERRPYC